MSCYLRVYGKFDPDVMAASLELPVDRIWKEGTQRRPGKTHEDSGLQICLSQASLHDYKNQFLDAEVFLEKYQQVIRRVTEDVDTLEAVVDFGLRLPSNPAFFRRIPASLIRSAASLRLAIELSFYACSDDDSSHLAQTDSPE
jgi:hypothetical protein